MWAGRVCVGWCGGVLRGLGGVLTGRCVCVCVCACVHGMLHGSVDAGEALSCAQVCA